MTYCLVSAYINVMPFSQHLSSTYFSRQSYIGMFSPLVKKILPLNYKRVEKIIIVKKLNILKVIPLYKKKGHNMLSTFYHVLYKLSKITYELLLLSWRECGSTGHFMHIWKQHT